ncbi:hypothetical protein BCV70DRAFT_223941, partial [Testicularia cyperi]
LTLKAVSDATRPGPYLFDPYLCPSRSQYLLQAFSKMFPKYGSVASVFAIAFLLTRSTANIVPVEKLEEPIAIFVKEGSETYASMLESLNRLMPDSTMKVMRTNFCLLLGSLLNYGASSSMENTGKTGFVQAKDWNRFWYKAAPEYQIREHNRPSAYERWFDDMGREARTKLYNERMQYQQFLREQANAAESSSEGSIDDMIAAMSAHHLA